MPREQFKVHWVAGAFYGLSQLAAFLSFAVCFYAGARLIDAGYVARCDGNLWYCGLSWC